MFLYPEISQDTSLTPGPEAADAAVFPEGSPEEKKGGKKRLMIRSGFWKGRSTKISSYGDIQHKSPSLVEVKSESQILRECYEKTRAILSQMPDDIKQQMTRDEFQLAQRLEKKLSLHLLGSPLGVMRVKITHIQNGAAKILKHADLAILTDNQKKTLDQIKLAATFGQSQKTLCRNICFLMLDLLKCEKESVDAFNEKYSHFAQALQQAPGFST